MNGKLNSITKFYWTTLFFGFIFIIPISSYGVKNHKTTSSRAESCLKLGQGDTQSGISQSDNKLPAPCCKPLKDRETKDLCGVPTGGGYQYACIACGDGKCDPELENTCNCHEDCK